MCDILSAANAYSKLLDIEYHIGLGRKNKSIPLSIIFEESQFFHLAGLQHLTDRITLLFGERSEIFRKILICTISAKQIESSVFYSEIADRFKYLSFLETIMDSNKTILKYSPQLEAFSSLMADFLLKNELQARNIFTFLLKDNLRGKYFCRSFFPQTDKDYSKNQTNWTLLYKKVFFSEIEILIVPYEYSSSQFIAFKT